MQVVNIFLGSSFRLMSMRRLIGDSIRKINDHWIKNGVQIKLHIWEDFIIGYSGKHKQQEYIDDMVLPSDICIFMFSHRVGIFTQMELEAKLKQNKDAVFCFRMPHKGSLQQSVIDSLNEIGVQAKDIVEEQIMCQEVNDIVENYIYRNITVDSNINKIKEMYFYTTIPDDLPKVQEEIGTTIRDFDDTTIDEWGIHCVLHPRKQLHLMDETDHYIPILKNEVSDEDLSELSNGIDKSSDQAHRMRRMSVFDMGNIFENNVKVHKLLEDAGIFTDKITDMNSLKWKLHKWMRTERKKILSVSTCLFELQNGLININNTPIASLAEIDESGKLEKSVSEIERLSLNIYNAIENKSTDLVVSSIVDERNRLKSILDARIAYGINSWTNDIIKDSEEFKEVINKCTQLEIKINELLEVHSGNKDELELKAMILQREKLEHWLTENNVTSPFRLLSYQLYMVAIFDTYLNGVAQSLDEDSLYKRIIATTEEFHINDPNVEMIRMNVGNMYARNNDYLNARKSYITAIQNLQVLYDKSVSMARNITYAITHLAHLDLDMGDADCVKESLMMFKEHISRLDILNDSYLIDQCLYITAELCSIDIEDGTAHDIVALAEEMFEKANNKLYLNPNDYAYGDIFVYLPNMIARYYIDHDSPEDATTYFLKAEKYINASWNNCLKLTEYRYEEGLFHQGELKHQLGFLYASKQHTWEKALDAYEAALNLKKRSFELTKYPSEEERIAQTLVNYGALELLILENIRCFQPTKEYKFSPLNKSLTALDIYKRHLSELEYYQALQLKATVLDYMHKLNKDNILLYNEATDAYYQCWIWNKANPKNQYRMKFVDYSGRALLQRRIISKEEYVKIRDICMTVFDN